MIRNTTEDVFKDPTVYVKNHRSSIPFEEMFIDELIPKHLLTPNNESESSLVFERDTDPVLNLSIPTVPSQLVTGSKLLSKVNK